MKTYHPISGSAEVCLYRYSTPMISVYKDRLTIGRVAELQTNHPEATIEFRRLHGLQAPAIILTSRSAYEEKDVCWQHALIDLPAETAETNAAVLTDFISKAVLEWWPDETTEQVEQVEQAQSTGEGE